jgi:hypothetical protein
MTQDYTTGTIKKLGQLFEDNYVFPDKGKEVKNYLYEQLEKGAYVGIENIDSLAARLKKDIQIISKDLHANVVVTKQDQEKEDDSPQDPMMDFFNSLDNYGFTKVDLLDDETGLLEISFFYPIQMDKKAADAASRAMQKFRDCSTIIFDLRKCKGGSPEMLNYLVTYLYPKGTKIHLNDFYYRPTEAYSSTYTLDSVPGERLDKTKVYVLTSGKTFSCGEEFAYDIKNLKRGTIVGEVTGGAAHPVQPMVVNERLQVLMPSGRAINPITKTNWEGIGVLPDIEVGAEKALDKVLAIISKP